MAVARRKPISKKPFRGSIGDEIVSEDEWELFASTEGSRFPQCQYSPSLYVSSKPRDHEGTTTDGTGVVLIGNALHAFPPDLGQGGKLGVLRRHGAGRIF